jgi:aminopeptidase N
MSWPIRETATDQDYANIEAVIAHEYFHNWTGNRITCRDWFQLCLKEGLTVFRDQEFSSDMRSRAVKRIADVRLLKSHQFPEDAGPLAHPVRPKKYKEINNFYTATVYEKGAEIVRMLKTVLGDVSFRAGMDLYLQRHDGEATTIEAFLTCFSEAAAADLGQFARWYEQAGTPQVTVKSHYDKTAHELTLELTQSISPLPGQPSADAAVIPLRFGLIDMDGADMPVSRVSGATVQDGVLVMDGEHQKIVFHNIPNRPVVSLLRGFSAPVRLEHHLSVEDLLFMASHDSDSFNRWQAVQTVATRDLIHLTSEVRSGKSPKPGNALVGAFGDILANQDLDPAFKAQLLDLPGEADIAREIGRNVDPASIHKARTLLKEAIAVSHTGALRSLIDNARNEDDYSPDAVSAGNRALANRALALYSMSGASDAADLVARRYRQATNMTDRLSALTCLVHQGLPGGAEALDEYLGRYQRVSLAMDKWFMVQATAPVGDGLEKVKSLTGHPLYDFSNPNRVRALVHAFATGNPTQFARPDGAGFDFVADNVLALDTRNPQVASRLLTCFRSWRALEASLAAQAEASLLRISTTDNLSRDSRDIVDRCLQ